MGRCRLPPGCLLGALGLVIACILYKGQGMWMRLSRAGTENNGLPIPYPPLSGYSDRSLYFPGDTLRLHISSVSPSCTLILEKPGRLGPDGILDLRVLQGLARRTVPSLASERGAGWPPALAYPLDPAMATGYFALTLKNGAQGFSVHFLVRNPAHPSRIAVFANTSTWTAYNAWGGASLYQNTHSRGPAYFVAYRRPNTALSGPAPSHDIGVEAHIFAWLDSAYGCQLFADPELEDERLDFSRYRVLVLPYHPEYFSAKMYRRLRGLVFREGKSLLYLGGNGIYHKVRWDGKDGRMECRKDMTSFSGTREFGGLWKWSLHPENTLLGVRFSQTGGGSFAPYRVMQPDHWLFRATGARAGDLFGLSSPAGKPLSGDETDKLEWLSPPHAVRLAKGINPASGHPVYPDSTARWDGKGGADMVFFPLGDGNGVFAAGSIASGAGLGHDRVFTRLVENFLARYLPDPGS